MRIKSSVSPKKSAVIWAVIGIILAIIGITMTVSTLVRVAEVRRFLAEIERSELDTFDIIDIVLDNSQSTLEVNFIANLLDVYKANDDDNLPSYDELFKLQGQTWNYAATSLITDIQFENGVGSDGIHLSAHKSFYDPAPNLSFKSHHNRPDNGNIHILGGYSCNFNVSPEDYLRNRNLPSINEVSYLKHALVPATNPTDYAILWSGNNWKEESSFVLLGPYIEYYCMDNYRHHDKEI